MTVIMFDVLLGLVALSVILSGIISVEAFTLPLPGKNSHRRLFRSSLHEQEVNGEAVIDATTTVTTFQSSPMQVYIEDTDAYGIMYNSNYLRCYDRALHATVDHEGWAIVSVDRQKFAASPGLGQEFVIAWENRFNHPFVIFSFNGFK